MFTTEELAHICGVGVTYLQKLVEEGFIDSELTRFAMNHVDNIRLIKRLESYEVGMSDIKKVLTGEIDIDEVLNIKSHEIENKIERERKRLERINGTMKSMAEGMPFTSDVSMGKVYRQQYSEIWLCSVRKRIHPHAINALLKKLQKKIESYNVEPCGSLIRICHDALPNAENADIELAFPVEPTQKTDFKNIKKRPGANYICIDIKAEYDDISLGYGALYEWIHKENLEVEGMAMEIFDAITLQENKLSSEIQLDIAKEPIPFKVKVCIPVRSDN